jgi:putative serine/threonine protein kinase
MSRSLGEERYRHVICYPSSKQEQLKSRLKDLKRLKISAVEFTGPKHVHSVPILGKGHVGIVVKAYRKDERVALKIRRTDADRLTMKHEAEMLQKANRVGVGPRLLGADTDFLLMEYVEGMLFPEWIESLEEGQDGKERLCHVLHSALEQAWKLDETGLDHGELSNAPKHIIVKENDEPCLVDFETASISRRVSNVTSLCQYLFLRKPNADLVKGKLGDINEEGLVNDLRRYKRKRNRMNFLRVLIMCKIHQS